MITMQSYTWENHCKFLLNHSENLLIKKKKCGSVMINGKHSCCCLLLKQVINSYQLKLTDVFTGNHIKNTSAAKNTK